MSPDQLAKMQGAWDPVVRLLRGNCMQCHDASFLEKRGKLTGTSAWTAFNSVPPPQPERLPGSVNYDDLVRLAGFISAHYGYYHLPENDQPRYQQLLKSGILLELK